MIVKVDPRPLIKLFSTFVGNTKVMFNFKTDGRVMYVQVLNDYTVTTSFPVKSVDGDFGEIDASVWVSKFVHVMAKDEEVQMTINDAVLFMEQSSFNCTLLREYESRRELPDVQGLDMKPAGVRRLKFLAHCGVSCMCMSKELSISDPDPVFANKRYYLNYNQAAFIESMDYPQVCIPFPTFRDFVFKLDDKATYAYLSDLDTLYFKSCEYEFWVSVTNYNINNYVITNLDKRLAGATLVTKVSFNAYKNNLFILASAFPNQKLSCTFGNGTFMIMANSNNSNVCVGDSITEALASLAITTAQLTAIVKLFGDDTEVEVKKGVGCLCLACGEKALLIAETVY